MNSHISHFVDLARQSFPLFLTKKKMSSFLNSSDGWPRTTHSVWVLLLRHVFQRETKAQWTVEKAPHYVGVVTGPCLVAEVWGWGLGSRRRDVSGRHKGGLAAQGREPPDSKARTGFQSGFSGSWLCDSKCSGHTSGHCCQEPWGHQHRSSATPGAFFKRKLKAVP